MAHCDQYADEPLKTGSPPHHPDRWRPFRLPSVTMHADDAMRARSVQVFKGTDLSTFGLTNHRRTVLLNHDHWGDFATRVFKNNAFDASETWRGLARRVSE